MSKHVAVLMGGWSAEREVSLVSGKACAKVLRERGYRVTEIDVDRDLAATLTALEPRPDVAFNALHGRYGEDGCVQGVLNILGLPYTHSGLLASALAMDKPIAKRVFAGAGIPCPEGIVVSLREAANGDVMDPPYVVKPANEGSSVGVRIVLEGDNYPGIDPAEWPFGDAVLVDYHSWTTSRHRIKSLDTENRLVEFTAPSRWPFGYWGKNERYYVEFVREAFGDRLRS